MSGFDLAGLLPYYLDETDEQIVALNDALLKLENDPADAAVLRDAFRLIHTIKGSSTVMGFEQVKDLTHHLETYFDQLRGGKRELDRATLDLSFRCLDGLREFNRQLRSGAEPTTDLSGLTAQVIASLSGEALPSSRPAEAAASGPGPGPETAPGVEVAVAAAETSCRRVTVVFIANLAWTDMKARLVLNRLASKTTILRSEPTAEQIESAEKVPTLRVWLQGLAPEEELRALADVEGVAEVLIDGDPGTDVGQGEEQGPAEPSGPEPAPEAPVEALTIARPEPAKTESPPVPAPAAKKVAETLRVDVDRLDSLMNLAGELVINRARFQEIAQGLEELFRDSNARLLTEETEDRLDQIGRELEAFVNQPAGRIDPRATVERWGLQFRRLRDNFTEIRRELALVRQGREQVIALTEAIHQFGRVTDGLQKGVLDTRMVPIGPLFDRFHRVVRDLRLASGKEVVLKIEGEKTELDKRMIDELSDPLIHMVRNSIDHGLEPPEERETLGKARAGTVALQASHRGNSVVITVTDDGRGINPQRVLRKVIEKGLISEEDAVRLTDRQIVQYIWHPGLSTAEAITDISGRGVGMDIVKSRIEGLNGTVDVRTEVGVGTTFTIRLPLTLAILPCLLFRIFEEVYAIPLDHIDEIVEVDDSRVFEVRGRRMIEIRDRLVSLVALDDILTWSGGPRGQRVGEALNGKRTVVVAENGETTIGLMVDQLIGMQEVVLKSLEKNFRPVMSLSGASILGDGRVSLILDVDTLINMVADATALRPA